MRIQCISTEPNTEQVKQLGDYYRPGKTRYPVDLGIEYTVLGLGVWGGVTWVEIAMPTEVVVSVPLFLFQITDPRGSAFWEVRSHADGALTLWPPAFYGEFFHDRLSEGHPELVEKLRELQRKIREEMDGH